MRYLGLASWIGVLGCLGLLAPSSARAQAAKNMAGSSGVVFVASGTDFNAVPTNLSRALELARLPLVVQEVFWGSANYVTDTAAQRNYRDKGLQLARRIKAVQTASPTQKIYLVGYSEGAVVILAAAEALPPGSIDRIILVTPAVNCKYDLRRVLGVARDGIDCFYCMEDNYQQLVGDLSGRPEESQFWPAGRVGFRSYIATYDDVLRYQKLRQHRWTQQMEQVIGLEGHFAHSRMRFMQHYLVPLLCPPHAQPVLSQREQDVQP